MDSITGIMQSQQVSNISKHIVDDNCVFQQVQHGQHIAAAAVHNSGLSWAMVVSMSMSIGGLYSA